MFGLGTLAGPVPTSGVLAVRVWKAPLVSIDADTGGGFFGVPILGTESAIQALKDQTDYAWLRARQYSFAQTALYALVMLLSLFAWMRNRKERILLWLTLYCLSPILLLFTGGMNLQVSFAAYAFWVLVSQCAFSIASWYLLLGLLELGRDPFWTRLTRILVWISILSYGFDTVLAIGNWWTDPEHYGIFLWVDWSTTLVYTALGIYPFFLVAGAIRSRRGSLALDRWLVAAFACLSELITFWSFSLTQGQRFTHFNLAAWLSEPLFKLNGNDFTPQIISDTLLLLAIIYALYNYTRSALQRQNTLEQEFKNARELQQLLIPEDLPSIPGYTVTTAYKPASEVGGDFFQIIPLVGGSTLVILGDVSGKGLKAAMAVSLIVGTIRAFAETTDSPAEILAGLNRRLHGRLQGGFATAIALRLDPNGSCVIASAGHTSPFINDRELDLPGAFPLGLAPVAIYEETILQLHSSEHLALYTDGLLEARSASGELYSFDRLRALFATQPTAEQATEAAVAFGQDDDITVLTLTRLATIS